MKYLIIILVIASCGTCEREDCTEYCEKIKFGDALRSLHIAVNQDINPRACYAIIDEVDPELTGNYCIEKNTNIDQE